MSMDAMRRPAGLDVLETGSGRPLIMIHSLLGDRSLFEPVMDALAARFRLIMPNLPPHGASTPMEQPATVEAYADRVAAMADAMDLPADTHVLGNGFGGFIAVMLALRHGGRFGRFVFADAGAGFPEAARGPLRAMADRVEADGLDGVLDVAVKRMFPQSYIDSHPDVIAERRRRLAEADPVAFAGAARALGILDMHGRIGAIANAVLVMVGSEDETTPPAMSRILRDGIPGAAYVEIAGAGHCPQVQEPRTFISHVTGFLDP